MGGGVGWVFFLMILQPPRSTLDLSPAASDVYKRQDPDRAAQNHGQDEEQVRSARVARGPERCVGNHRDPPRVAPNGRAGSTSGCRGLPEGRGLEQRAGLVRDPQVIAVEHAFAKAVANQLLTVEDAIHVADDPPGAQDRKVRDDPPRPLKEHQLSLIHI